MSTLENPRSVRFDTAPPIQQLLDDWTSGLAQVFEGMTERRPEVSWQAMSGTLAEISAATGMDEAADILWWEQPFQAAPGMMVWVGTPRVLWEHAGGVTLRAAGLDAFEPDEARNTWLEILAQSFSATARAIGSLLAREVSSTAGMERAPAVEMREWATMTLRFGDDTPNAPALLALSPALVAGLCAPKREEKPAVETAAASPSTPEAAGTPILRSRTMDLLLDLNLPISISFGKAHLPIKEVLQLTTGSIVELNRGVNEQVEVLVNERLIARGEVVVVDGNYGVRIQEIASRQDRLGALA